MYNLGLGGSPGLGRGSSTDSPPPNHVSHFPAFSTFFRPNVPSKIGLKKAALLRPLRRTTTRELRKKKKIDHLTAWNYMPFLSRAKPVLGQTTFSGRTRGKPATLEAECYEKSYKQRRKPPPPYDHGVEANAQAHHGEAFTITHKGASRRKQTRKTPSPLLKTL